MFSSALRTLFGAGGAQGRSLSRTGDCNSFVSNDKNHVGYMPDGCRTVGERCVAMLPMGNYGQPTPNPCFP